MPHFPEYYPTLQSISHLSNRGRDWVRKNSEMMIVVVVRSLQSSSVGVYYYTQYNIMFEECSELHISCKSGLKLQTRSLSWVPSAAANCSLRLCPDMRCWNGDKTWQTPVSMSRVWCVLWSWQQLHHCSVVVVAVVSDHPAYDSCGVTPGPTNPL